LTRCERSGQNSKDHQLDPYHRVSWRHELSDEEMKITEPLMEKIQQLRAMPKKELPGIQLIRTFIERRV
jgi:hypothetical protein